MLWLTQSITETDPTDGKPAAQLRAPSTAQPGADTIGESDISDDEDWFSQPAEPIKANAVPKTAASAATATAAPIAPPAAATLAPISLSTAAQPAFQDEDDYDADDKAAPTAAAAPPSSLPASTAASSAQLTPVVPTVAPSKTAAAPSAAAAAAASDSGAPSTAAGSTDAAAAAVASGLGAPISPTRNAVTTAATSTASVPHATPAAPIASVPEAQSVPQGGVLSRLTSLQRQVRLCNAGHNPPWLPKCMHMR